jgi:hypothetical protein
MEIIMRIEIENLENLALSDIYAEGEMFLNVLDGIKFVEFCETKIWAIIGIEGGVFENGIFTPDLDLVMDYSSNAKKNSWHLFHNECNSKAIKFLSNFIEQTNMRFYLAFIDEKEFEICSHLT